MDVSENRLKELISEIQNGNMNHFTEFYNITKKLVFYNIYALTKNNEQAEDILSDTYVKFLSNIQSLDTSNSIKGYLLTISRNLTMDYFKKNNRIINDEERIERHSEKTTHNVDEEILLEKVKGILNDKEFEIFVLHVLDELTFEEIAKLKKRPLGTIIWSYNNSIKKIRKEVKL